MQLQALNVKYKVTLLHTHQAKPLCSRSLIRFTQKYSM